MTQGTLAQTQNQKQLKRARRVVYEQCHALGITHDDIAAEAHCTRPYVAHYFAGRRSPRAVELAIEKLLAERRALRRRGPNGGRPQSAREGTESAAAPGSGEPRGSRAGRPAHSRRA